MRRTIVVLFALLAAPLLGASPSLAIKPTVMVFPFTASTTTVDREASSRLATIIASQMAEDKTITVVPAPAGTARKDYLKVAKEHDADFYVSGYVSPLGDGVSVVEQVVTVRGGIVAFSNTAQLQTYADAAGQGDTLAQAIAAYANRAFASLPTPPPAATPAPSEPGANIGRIFGKHGSAAAPSTAPAAAASSQPTTIGSTSTAVTYDLNTIAVLPVTGTAPPPMRDAATLRLQAHEPGVQAATLQAACATHPRATVLQGDLSQKIGHGLFNSGRAEATFTLKVEDCGGRQIWQTSETRGGIRNARDVMDDAIDAAVATFDHAKAQAEVSAGG